MDPEARLYIIYGASSICGLFILLLGQTLEHTWHYMAVAVFDVAQLIGVNIISTAINAYLGDAYPEAAGEVDCWIVIGRTMGGFHGDVYRAAVGAEGRTCVCARYTGWHYVGGIDLDRISSGFRQEDQAMARTNNISRWDDLRELGRRPTLEMYRSANADSQAQRFGLILSP